MAGVRDAIAVVRWFARDGAAAPRGGDELAVGGSFVGVFSSVDFRVLLHRLFVCGTLECWSFT